MNNEEEGGRKSPRSSYIYPNYSIELNSAAYSIYNLESVGRVGGDYFIRIDFYPSLVLRLLVGCIFSLGSPRRMGKLFPSLAYRFFYRIAF